MPLVHLVCLCLANGKEGIPGRSSPRPDAGQGWGLSDGYSPCCWGEAEATFSSCTRAYSLSEWYKKEGLLFILRSTVM